MPAKTTKTKAKTEKKTKPTRRAKPKSAVQAKSRRKTSTEKETQSSDQVKVVNHFAAPQAAERKVSRAPRVQPQYAFMKAPGNLHDFQVGKKIEVYCDHDRSKERIRGWIDGVIVQIDNKMVAVQFRSNVYLTDGWMVPDRILWYPLNSEHVRPVGGGKKSVKKEIPDY
ncbi:MAG TPA: hypothetical protein VJ972_15280 [Anaerolineales bacterium]|nr:hypothetical protein [Anaerolineales bacterium]